VNEPSGIHIITGAASADIIRPGIQYTWRNVSTTAMRMQALVSTLVDQLKVKTAAVVTENYSYALDIRKFFVESFTKKGGIIVTNELVWCI
jgi:ABC-type branched-subunit amino acid transport system substrate-binding protein